jgi:Aspartyl protease
MKKGLLAVLVAGCSVGAPVGFSNGESWTAPMVGPLEDGLLLVPVFVNGKGPYTFAIDPDANVSVLAQHVVNEAKLRIGQGPKLDDESDTQRDRFYAETLGLEVGTLTVERLSAEVLGDHAFDLDGRQIDGLLGRDVIADSLGFEFDRDRGMITLMTQKAFDREVAAFGGTPLPYKPLSAQILAATQPVTRKLVDAKIDGAPFTVHLDFGATMSQLRDRSWQKAGLIGSAQTGSVIDEVGTLRTIDHLGQAATVELGGITTQNVEFVPYIDKRWHDEDFEGTIGLNFFHAQTVLVNWDKNTIYTKPRGDLAGTTAQRIARWQSSLMPKCAHVGCVTISMIDPLAGKPVGERPAQHPGIVVSVVRDPASANVALEALVAVKSAEPGSNPQWLVVNLPAKVDRAMTHLSGSYVGAQLSVVDASPFPRECPDHGGCIDAIRPPYEAGGSMPAAPAPAPEAAPEPAPAAP